MSTTELALRDADKRRAATETVRDRILSLAVSSEEDYESAALALKKVNDTEKQVKEWFAPMVRQAKSTYDTIRAKQKEVVEPLGEAKRHLRDTMSGFLEARKRDAEKIATEAPEGAIVPAAQEPKSDAVYTRKTWAFEIVDEKKVPKDYWAIDEKALRAAVKAGEREIPGVRIYQKETVVPK